MSFTIIILYMTFILLSIFTKYGSSQAVDNFSIDQPASVTTIVSASSYGMSPANPDNSDALAAAIDACPAGPCKVVVDPGTYRMAGSNSLIFMLLTDFELDGGGSTFLFHRDNIVDQASGQSPPLIYIYQCLRCKWGNFVIDWDWDRWALASTVTIVNATSTQFTLRFNDYTSINTTTFFDYQVLSQLDPTTGAIGVHNGREYFLTGQLTSATQVFPAKARIGAVADVVQQSSNIMTITFKNAVANPPKVGDLYLLRHLVYEIHGFYGRACKHCTFSGITLRGVPGKCFTLGEDTQFLLFQGIKVVRQPLATTSPSGANFRPVSSTADGIFVAKTMGFIKIIDYEFSWGGDDAINIHNPTSSKGFTILSSRVIQVSNSPTWRITYRVGDEISFFNGDFTQTNFFARVKSAAYNGGDTWTVELNRALPTRFSSTASSMMISQSRYRASNVVIKNAYLHHHRARGMLIQSSSTLVQDSSLLHIHMACIAIRSSAWWSEGTGVRYVKVTNTTFERCDKSGNGQDKGALRIDGQMTSGAFGATWRLHSDIEVTNNRFTNVPGRVWDVSSASRVAVTGNTVNVGPANLSEPVIDASSGEPYVQGQARIAVSKDVLISGNTWIVRDVNNRPWTDPWSVDAGTTTNVLTTGNSVVQQGVRRMLMPQRVEMELVPDAEAFVME